MKHSTILQSAFVSSLNSKLTASGSLLINVWPSKNDTTVICNINILDSQHETLKVQCSSLLSLSNDMIMMMIFSFLLKCTLLHFIYLLYDEIAAIFSLK